MLASLHGHGEYSLLDGAGTARQHAEAAIKAGYGALALTDHGTLAGSLHHMTACREAGIMPIIGCEVYYRPNRKVQGQKEWLKTYYHLTLLAKDLRGWRSLMRIVSEAHRSGFYNKACVDDELLFLHHEGLICLTGCVGGRLAKSITAEDDRGAEAWFRQLKNIFCDDLIVEIMPHDFDDLRVINIEAVRMAQRHGTAVVTTLDEHYPEVEWAPTQDVLLMIATNQTLKKREKKRQEGEDVYEFTMKTFFHMTEEQIRSMYAQFHPSLSQQVIDESIHNQLLVAARCTPFVVDRSEKMPVVSFPGVDDNEMYLRKLTYEGLARRGYAGNGVYAAQADYELSVFKKLGSIDQMLMAWDVVNWARSDRPIPKRDKKTSQLIFESSKRPIMTFCRGSAAGSTVSWAIGLSSINQIKHKLIFERFLNPDRKGKPDVDIDVPPDRVDEIESYLKVIHGKDRVVDIIAHSTFGPRASLTDAGRVLCVPYDHVKAATKTIDDQERGKLSDIRLVNTAVDRLAVDYPKLWSEACRIQGSVARKSEHAGGMLILPGPVEEYIPVERQGGMKGKLLSAFGERSGRGNQLISDYGFNKLDILRVAELTKQQKAVDLIRESTGEVIDLETLPVHDDPYACEPEVMQGFKDGWLVGVFQFSATASKLTRQIKPDNIFDLSAINALIRPGPRGAGLDQTYARRKNGDEAITYWHPLLESVLSFTYGVVAFQETLMEVVHKFGGLTLAQADSFRKIVSKEYRDPVRARAIMAEWGPRVKKGFMANGLTADEAEVVWQNTCQSFSEYAFNLSHSDGYSVLAYRDMWLKIHYPRQFYAAFLSVGLSQVTKKKILQKAEAIREARHMGLKILPPDINESGRDYTVVEEGIRLGLLSIKNIGPAAASVIEEYRPFDSYEQIQQRCPAKALNVTGRASLVMSGACDRWGKRDEYTEDHIDQLERNLLGMSLTSVYSIAAYADAIEGRFWTEEEFESAEDGTRVAIVGEISNIKEHVDVKGNTMAFIDLVYGPNQWNCTLFASMYAEYHDLIHSRRPLLITGAKNTHKGKMGLKVEALPCDDDGEWVPPIMDLSQYVDMIGDQEEQLASDSVFPEDLQESIDDNLVTA